MLVKEYLNCICAKTSIVIKPLSLEWTGKRLPNTIIYCRFSHSGGLEKGWSESKVSAGVADCGFSDKIIAKRLLNMNVKRLDDFRYGLVISVDDIK